MKRGAFTAVVRIVTRSLRQHAVSSSITALSVALACGLTMAVFVIDRQASTAFISGGRGFDAVLGARGSALQLVLNSVFHLETSPGNIPWKMYTALRDDPRVSLAIPYAVGDNYQGFRIVGTTLDIFEKYELRPGQKLRLLSGGKVFDPQQRQAVLGSETARRTGLSVGSTFNSYHGLSYRADMQHPDRFEVVGIVEPTGGPMDRVVWVPIDSIYRMTGHSLAGSGQTYTPQAGQEIPDESKEVSAVMLKFRGAATGFAMDATINRQGNAATLAWPIAKVVAEVFEKVGWVSKVLSLVACMVVIVAAGSILAAMYNTMNERRRELAILRALGAPRRILFTAIVTEAGAVAACGVIAGFVVYAAILAIVASIVRDQTGVILEVWQPDPVMWRVPLGMIVLGALAGVVPAIKAYRTDVASNIGPLS